MAAVALGSMTLLAVPGAAQDRSERPRTLLQFLFGSGGENRAPPPDTAVAPTKPKAKSRKSAGSQVPQAQEPAALAKLDTAKAVVVIGDFMAAGLSQGLVSAYAQNPDIKIVDRSNGSSGFVRDDFFDWPGQAGALLDAEKPAAVVVMLGANDRQPMKIGEERRQPLSDGWTKEYQARTDALAAAIRQRGLPIIWVGLPAFKSASVSSDILALNDIYRKSAETAGGTFVDIWDGFVDENGAFVTNGPDMKGQAVRLRGSDGVTLTTAGKRKVAFYVEKPLNKLLGSETVPSAGPAGPEAAGPAAPINLNVDRTPPMAIDDPELDGGQVLLGLPAAPKVKIRTLAEKLTVEGLASSAPAGRADDFGGASTAATATRGATAAAGLVSPETTNAIERPPGR